jgi:SAM-dependent methyltransferase
LAKTQIYGHDLAQVHITGYDFHWLGAASSILGWLQQSGIHSGTVVDLGCGGGQWLARLAKHGYDAVGVDVSSAMIRAARKCAPTAKIYRGSFADVELPTCDAVTSLGEPLNYLDGPRNFRRTLKNVATSLRPGGLFIFDVRTPPTKVIETRTAVRVGEDWACIALIDENSRRIVRRITTFRGTGSIYHRGEETHTLRLYPKRAIAGWLRKLGFRVRIFRAYGDFRLGPRQAVFVARKPGELVA